MDFLFDWKPFETVFMHGDKKERVSMELMPLDREGMLLILPCLSKMDGIDIKGKKKEDIEPEVFEKLMTLQLETQKHALTIFPNHVRNIKGITINGGEPSSEMLSSQSVFSALVFMILSQLATMSSLGDGDEKNLEGPSNQQAQETEKE